MMFTSDRYLHERTLDITEGIGEKIKALIRLHNCIGGSQTATSGPSCSKLTMLLVNDSLKF